MRNIFKKIITSLLICMSYTVCALECNYFGVDYKYRHMHGRSSGGYSMRQSLPTNYNEGEIYYIHRFKSDVGINIGYEQSQNKKQTYVFSANQEFLGNPQYAGDVSYIRNKLQAAQFDMVGYIDFGKQIELLGQFGFSIMHADMSGTIRSLNITTNLAPSKSYAFIPRLSLGIQYFIMKSNIGIRLMGTWEGTRLYRLKMTDDDGVRHTIRPFNQSWCYSVGLVGKF